MRGLVKNTRKTECDAICSTQEIAVRAAPFALLIALGNRFRRDDGVAHVVLDRLGSVCEAESRSLLQLTPEVAEEIAGYETVIFIDSDTRAAGVSIEPLDEPSSPPLFTHVARPAEVIEVSKALFGFAGRAFLCRIPVDDLSPGEGLSGHASAFAAQAAGMLEIWLSGLRVERHGGI